MSLALIAALGLMAAAAPPAPPFRAAVVVGVNDAFDEAQDDLRYADDDAARYAELLRPTVDHLELLTILDTESQEIFPEAAAAARLPDEAGLLAALARARDLARQARGEGRKTELYFIYIGHGRVRGGIGEVRLVAGALARPKLASEVLADTHFDRKHLVVDACSAYMLLNARGDAEPDVEAAFEQFFEAQALDEYPDVGAVLATSGIGPTHEWSGYQGGVFSHEVRSALAGAADADGNGRVEYVEVEAFLAAANLDVPILKGRPKVFVHSPRIERRATLVQIDESQPALTLPAELSGHYVLEDGRGLRHAELHKESGFAVQLRLTPGLSYVLRDDSGADLLRIDRAHGPTQLLLPLEPQPSADKRRGETSPHGVFGTAFGPRFAAGFAAQWQASLPEPPLARVSAPRTWTRPVAGGSAVLLGAAALGLSLWQRQVADNHYDDYNLAFNDAERDASKASSGQARTRSAALAIGAAVGLLGGGLLLGFEFFDAPAPN